VAKIQHLEDGASKPHVADPVERYVQEALEQAGVKYTHETENKEQGLDFYLPNLGVYIECKAYYADRINKQIEGKQVIVVQGYGAARVFKRLLTGEESL